MKRKLQLESSEFEEVFEEIEEEEIEMDAFVEQTLGEVEGVSEEYLEAQTEEFEQMPEELEEVEEVEEIEELEETEEFEEIEELEELEETEEFEEIEELEELEETEEFEEVEELEELEETEEFEEIEELEEVEETEEFEEIEELEEVEEIEEEISEKQTFEFDGGLSEESDDDIVNQIFQELSDSKYTSESGSELLYETDTQESDDFMGLLNLKRSMRLKILIWRMQKGSPLLKMRRILKK